MPLRKIIDGNPPLPSPVRIFILLYPIKNDIIETLSEAHSVLMRIYNIYLITRNGPFQKLVPPGVNAPCYSTRYLRYEH